MKLTRLGQFLNKFMQLPSLKEIDIIRKSGFRPQVVGCFFIAININIADLDINKTEFDDYKWLDYENAMELSKTIYQYGKQRVTIDALEKLRSLDLL